MATTTRFPFFDTQFFAPNSDGIWAPAANYFLDQYISGTTTDQDTFSDPAGAVPHSHPLQLDSEGRCTLYGTPGELYTFVLRATALGTPVDTFNDVAPVTVEVEGDFLPLAGGTMEGTLTLEADPTSGLEAATKQYVDDAIVSALATMQSLVDTATEAAADATAAAAAIKPPGYTISSATGGAVSRSVYLQAGTWEVVLETRARAANPAASSISATVTQDADVGTTSVSTSVAITKAASDTQTTNVSVIAVGSLVVVTPGNYTMSMDAVSLASQTSQGSTLTVSLQ